MLSSGKPGYSPVCGNFLIHTPAVCYLPLSTPLRPNYVLNTTNTLLRHLTFLQPWMHSTTGKKGPRFFIIMIAQICVVHLKQAFFSSMKLVLIPVLIIALRFPWSLNCTQSANKLLRSRHSVEGFLPPMSLTVHCDTNSAGALKAF
jgi:hypothetical protein